jgi:hypothetical protein
MNRVALLYYLDELNRVVLDMIDIKHLMLRAELTTRKRERNEALSKLKRRIRLLMAAIG